MAASAWSYDFSWEKRYLQGFKESWFNKIMIMNVKLSC